MNDENWEYSCIVTDINIHDGTVFFTVDNPQHKWQERGLSFKPDFVKLRVGDKVTIKFKSTTWSGYYYVADVFPTDTPGTPTYEKVNQGRWYDHYLCCSKADRSEKFCVCSCVVDCPVHGSVHIGTHD